MFPLLNEGREAGASLAHTHSQLVVAARAGARASTAARRAVAGAGRASTVACPWASRVPYETVIAPIEPERRSVRRAPGSGLRSKLLADVVRRLQRLEGQVPLNAWLEQGEGDWRLVLFPRLNILAGLELGAGISRQHSAARRGGGQAARGLS